MICCVTGHRPSGFSFPRICTNPLYMDYFMKLSHEIEMLIWMGYDTFLSGMADGADLDFADMVIMYKRTYQGISLEAVLPYPSKPAKRMTPYQTRRDSALLKCDKIHIVSDHYFQGCMDKRNRFMVDRADMLYAIWNREEHGGTWNTIQYARSKEKPIRYLMLNELNDYGLL